MKLRRIQSFLVVIAVCAGLVVSFINPTPVQAADELYKWTNTGAINVSGGDLQLGADLKFTSTSGFGLIDNYRASVQYKTGCIFSLQVSVNRVTGTNTLDIPLSACTDAVNNQYIGKQITITGTRPAIPTNVTITVWSPQPSSTSPRSLLINVRNAAGHVAGITGNKTADPNSPSDTLPDKQAVFYRAVFTFELKENTEYTVCSDNPAILNCSATTTGDYTSAACAAGLPTCYNFKTPFGRTASFTFNTQPVLADTTSFCDQPTSSDIGWLLCAAIESIAEAAEKFDAFVIEQLVIKTDPIFNTSKTSVKDAQSSAAFYKAWGVFRNIAYALLIIIGLLMVISQMLDLEIVSALTLRKMLPGLVAAVIIIPLSWPILGFLFSASNAASFAVMDLISAPFRGISVPSVIDGGKITMGALVSLVTIVGAVGGVSYLAILGMGGIFALIGSALLAILSAVVLLAARNVVAYIIIIAAPLAIICATFDPFKKLFTLWRTLLITILLSTIAVAAVIELSHVGALIALISSTSGLAVVTAFAILIGGYALVWSIFKKLDAVAGQLGNVVSATTGRLQKGLASYRNNTAKKRLGEAVEGKRRFGGPLGAFGNLGANLVRRGQLSSDTGLGAFGIGKTGRAKYKEAVRTMQAKSVAGMMDQDHDRAGGDDDAMQLLAQRGMNQGRFLREYAALQRRNNPSMSEAEANQRANNALGLTQSSFGALAGSSAMRVAAQKSLLKSNTSYRRNANGEEMDFNEMTNTMYNDVGSLVSEGLITAADGAAMIKSNSARADRAGVGFGTAIARLDQVARGQALSTDQTRAMANEALQGTGPGQLIGQRHEAIRILAPEMMRRAEEAYRADGNQAGPQFIQQIAAAAGRRDMAGQLPELNAGLYAEGMEGQEIAGRTVAQWEEYFRSAGPDPAANPAAATQFRNQQQVFQEYRREYSNAAQQSQQRSDYDLAA